MVVKRQIAQLEAIWVMHIKSSLVIQLKRKDKSTNNMRDIAIF